MTITIQPDLLREEHFPVDFGRYRLLGVLGEGGMARVFRAELQGQEGFRKPTAIKVIHAAIAARGEALRRSLINEARTGGLLHHPNIVDTYDYGEVEGLPYIAMEYVRGVGLDDVLAERGALEPALALEIGAQICAGLEHAHDLEVDGVAANLVHRDLKPSNIILSRDGLTKVMDFGIAKATTNAYSTTQTGTTKGTPAYMSPEQASGHDLDRRSDVFAVGALLYEMVVGVRFFQGDTLMSLLMSVVKVEEMIADAVKMAPLDAACPGLADVVRRCLRQDPGDRWDSAGEVELQLKTLARQLPVGTPLRRFVRSFSFEDTSGTGSLRSDGGTPWSPPIGAPGGTAPAATAPATERSTAAPPVPATRLQIRSEPTVQPPPGVDPTLWRTEEDEDGGLPWAPLIAGFGGTVLVAGLLFAVFGGQDPPPAPAPEPVVAESPEEPAQAEEDAVADELAEEALSEDPVAAAEPTPALVPAPVPAVVRAPDPTPGRSPDPTPAAQPDPTPRRSVDPVSVEASPRPRQPAATEYGITSGDAREVERTADGMVVRFAVRIAQSSPDDEVTVHFNPPKARWVSRRMRHAGGGRWVVNVTFPKKSVGKTYWWVEAKPADGDGTERWGSDASPKKVKLRW